MPVLESFSLHTELSFEECKQRLEQTTVKPPSYFRWVIVSLFSRRWGSDVIGAFDADKFTLYLWKRQGTEPQLKGSLLGGKANGTDIVCQIVCWLSVALRVSVLLGFILLFALTPRKISNQNLFSHMTSADLRESLCVMAIFAGFIAVIFFVVYPLVIATESKYLKNFLIRTLDATEKTES